jgi:hypothetical protein
MLGAIPGGRIALRLRGLFCTRPGCEGKRGVSLRSKIATPGQPQNRICDDATNRKKPFVKRLSD